ncbi:Glucose-methanol-choline oxidoreductase [Penicillium concentricum]|uniref:Glucose-methanol-choline oxidoreductase n=1 Tax=Penicillium concentricum TaxID=293559 RepID=A0A9W9RUE6_9EURO|nr:Glucose-methanol-choline oxidoreductase [Penicillium concentricum]KAJ5365179.1 Glucose-methanol-choline oxidoreductase [Penicillium concentricum]
MGNETLQQFAALDLDYLIIGGGTAGLAIAARLTEDPEFRVGVIEAGPSVLDIDDNGAINVPGRYGETIGSKYDWKFKTTPQPGLGGRSLPWPRGRILGGTSALNLMAWNRGHRKDYDAWAELGNEKWGWEDLLPFFRRSENFHPPSVAHQKHYHSSYDPQANGTKGPIHTTHAKQYGPTHQYWHEALNSLGVPSTRDSLAGDNTGVWNMLCTIDPDTQERSYSASAYYHPIAKRPNLHILTEATAMEILFESEDDDWYAVGARVRWNGLEANIKAYEETIICAGSVQSPQLLELSGIGNQDVLEAAGIETKVHSPNVGENLQEHMMTATIFEIPSTIPTRDDILKDPIQREAADCAYYASQTGPWTVMPCSVAYCPLSKILSPEECDELHTQAKEVARGTGRTHDAILASQFESGEARGQIEYLFDLGNWSPYFVSEPGKKYATMLQMLQYPFSRGSIHIPPMSDNNYEKATIDDKPVIDPRYFLGPGEIDKKVMAKALRWGDQICQTEPLAKLIRGRVFPPPAKAGDSEEKVFEEFVSNYTVTDWHPVGTCAMGEADGINGGVVNDMLQVHGVHALRVVDASIMPLQVGAHIQATVYAIAEKAAEMIIEDYFARNGPL